MKHEHLDITTVAFALPAVGAALLALCLTACASFWLAGGLPLLKIAPSALGMQTVEQRVVIAWPNEQRTLETVLGVHGETLTVIGLAFGARLFSFDYDGERIVETQPLPKNMSASRMANDLLLVYAPIAALRTALPSGWTVLEKQGTRQVFLDGKLNIAISYSGGAPLPGRVVLDNQALCYQLTIDSREATADEP